MTGVQTCALPIYPGNDLLRHFNRRRLDAEEIRDALLALGGELDRGPGGAHPFPAESLWAYTQHNPFTAVYETRHRSVYLMQQRIKRHPFLATFDGADPNSSTAGRAASTTPLQALFMMNDPFAHERAAKFAARLLRECGDETRRLDLACQLAFGRPARPEEIRAGENHLKNFRAKLKPVGGAAEAQTQSAWESQIGRAHV